jgi:hypothetical protein
VHGVSLFGIGREAHFKAGLKGWNSSQGCSFGAGFRRPCFLVARYDGQGMRSILRFLQFFPSSSIFFSVFQLFFQISRIFSISVASKMLQTTTKRRNWKFLIFLEYLCEKIKKVRKIRNVRACFWFLWFWVCFHQKERKKSCKMSYWTLKNSTIRPRTSPYKPPKSEKSEYTTHGVFKVFEHFFLDYIFQDSR